MQTNNTNCVASFQDVSLAFLFDIINTSNAQ